MARQETPAASEQLVKLLGATGAIISAIVAITQGGETAITVGMIALGIVVIFFTFTTPSPSPSIKWAVAAVTVIAVAAALVIPWLVWPRGRVEGQVFVDANGNGFHDPSETLLDLPAEIVLTDSAGVEHRTQAAEGTFAFDSVPRGSYGITLPAYQLGVGGDLTERLAFLRLAVPAAAPSSAEVAAATPAATPAPTPAALSSGRSITWRGGESGWVSEFLSLSDVPPGADYAILIDYGMEAEGDYGGWGVADITGLDISDYDALVFWARGQSGTERFDVRIKDRAAVEQIAGPYQVSQSWEQISVPLFNFGNVNLSDVQLIALGFDSTTRLDSGTGRIWIGPFTFEKAEE
jgi:hypothetical protein